MKITIANYSLVIIGNSHNPTVISDAFFLKSGIVSDINEIDKNSLLITPGFCRATLKKNTYFIVEPNSLKISSSESKIPYEIGNKYCSSLGYIKSIAVGINFDIIVEEFDFDHWFKPLSLTDYRDCVTNSIVFSFNASKSTKSNVTISRLDQKKALLKFNFHIETSEVILSNLNMDFVSLSEEYIIQANEFIINLLK